MLTKLIGINHTRLNQLYGDSYIHINTALAEQQTVMIITFPTAKDAVELKSYEFNAALSKMAHSIKRGHVTALNLAYIDESLIVDTIMLIKKRMLRFFPKTNYSTDIRETVGFRIKEILKNAFAHGNQKDTTLPIYIHMEKSSTGQVQSIDVYDNASKKGKHSYEKITSLSGFGFGEFLLKSGYETHELEINYCRSKVIIDEKHLATRTTLSFKVPPKLVLSSSAME